jgi:hypothetical protein
VIDGKETSRLANSAFALYGPRLPCRGVFSLAGATAANSVLSGINTSPNQTTGGEEVQFILTFPRGIMLPVDHYFLNLEIGLTSGNFF